MKRIYFYFPLMKTCVFIITLIASNGLFAQDFEWANTVDLGFFGESRDMAVDAAGNSYTTGRFSGTHDFDPGVGVFNLTATNFDYDAYVSKLDPSGNFLWAFKIGDFGSDAGGSMGLDVAGNLVVQFEFEGTVDFDPGAGTTNLTSSGGTNLAIVKYTPAGTFIWAGGLIGTGNSVSRDLHIDGSDNIYITGFFGGSLDVDPGPGTTVLTPTNDGTYIVKLNSTGALVWGNFINGGRGLSITTDASANVYCGGRYENTVDFDPGAGVANITSVGSTDGFVVKLNSVGAYVWSKSLGGASGQEYVNSVKIDGSGNVILAGQFNGTVDLDPGAGVNNITAAGGSEGYITSWTSAGNINWGYNIFGSTGAWELWLDALDNIFVVGAFDQITDFDIGPAVMNLTPIAGSDLFVAKYSSSAVLEWAAPIGGSGSGYIASIALDATENVYITGDLYGELDFDPGAGVFNLTSTNGQPYVLKLSQCVANSITPDLAFLSDLTGECTVSAPTAPTATNNCGMTVNGVPNITFPVTFQGLTIVTWTYNDGLGNSISVLQNLIIDDITDPVTPTLADLTAACTVTATAPATTDNCLGVVTGTTTDPLTYSTQGTFIINWTFDDGNGNTIIVPQNVVILNGTVTGTDVIEECGSFYNWIDGNTYFVNNNTATHTITSAAGCDSIVTLDLTFLMPATGTDVQTACVQYTWINGNVYVNSNNTATYTYVGGAANGCDSTVALDLTILSPATGTDLQTACDQYTWIDGNTYAGSNNTTTYTYIGGAANGCDSIVTLDLTILTPTTGTDVQSACVQYTWINGIVYASSNNTATYTYIGGAANGCDSIVTLDLTILTPATSTDAHTACAQYTWIDGNTYASSDNTTTYTYVGAAANGCDSIVTIDLTILAPAIGTDVQSACVEYTWINGTVYASSNSTATYTIVGGAASGCDSIVILELTIINEASGIDTRTECDAFVWLDGNTYTSSNNVATFVFTNGAANGCDSLVTLDLVIVNSSVYSDVIEACDSIVWIDGNTYTSDNNIAFHVIPNVAGCDSTITLDLTIYTVDVMVTNASPTLTASESGATYQWIDCDNNNASIAGATEQSFTAIENGSYAVIVTNDNCSDTSACEVVANIGIEELLDSEIVVYPNPTNDGHFTVQYSGVIEAIILYDVAGRTVQVPSNVNTGKVDASKLESGKYSVYIQTDKGQLIKSVVIAK
jgi:hypothetical protein